MTAQPPDTAAPTPGPYTASFFQNGRAIIRGKDNHIVAEVSIQNTPGWPGVAIANVELLCASWTTAAERDRLAEVNERLVKALESNASWLAFVLKGIRQDYIEDQTVIGTSDEDSSMRSLSEVVEGELKIARAALAEARTPPIGRSSEGVGG